MLFHPFLLLLEPFVVKVNVQVAQERQQIVLSIEVDGAAHSNNKEQVQMKYCFLHPNLLV